MTVNDDNFIDYLGALETKGTLADAKKVTALCSTVLQKAGLKKKAADIKKLRRVLFIAAAVSVCAVMTAAAIGFNFGDMFRGYFEATDPHRAKSAASLTQSQLDILNKSGTQINQSKTCIGTTITLKSAIGDNGSIYILGDIITPDRLKLDKSNYEFHYPNLNIEAGYNYRITFLKDDNPNDNKRSFILYFLISNQLNLQGKNIKLSLSDLSVPTNKNPFYTPIVKGNWDFDFQLGYDTPGRKIAVNKITHYIGLKERGKPDTTTLQGNVKVIELSPFSVLIDYTDVRYMKDFSIPGTITVKFKNGAQKQLEIKGGEIDDRHAIASSSFVFDSPIDISSVSSITVGDLTIPVP